MKASTKKKISASEFDEKFDNGESVMEYLDLENARISVQLLMHTKLRSGLLRKAKKSKLSLEDFIIRELEKIVG